MHQPSCQLFWIKSLTAWTIRTCSRYVCATRYGFSKNFQCKILICILYISWFITPSLLASNCFGISRPSHFIRLQYIVWLRITDEGSIPKMRMRSILLIQSDFKNDFSDWWKSLFVFQLNFPSLSCSCFYIVTSQWLNWIMFSWSSWWFTLKYVVHVYLAIR